MKERLIIELAIIVADAVVRIFSKRKADERKQKREARKKAEAMKEAIEKEKWN